jgi:recombination associated protein RdgC
VWFKNLQLYCFPAPWKISAAQLEEQLRPFAFQPPTSFQLLAQGWAAPRDNGPLVHTVNGQFLICLATEKKLLPSSVIKEVTKARALVAEQQQGYKPGKKQLRELKQQVTDELLPRAFNVRRATAVWIDPVNGWLAVDAASAGRADEVIGLINKSLLDLRLTRVDTAQSPVTAMTGWLAADATPHGFSVDDEAELQSPAEEKATVRFVRHALDPVDVKRHISAGKQCTRLALTWADRVSFVLTEALTLKKLALVDVLRESADAADGSGDKAQGADERFDADFALMTGQLQHLFVDLTEALGGNKEGVARKAA